MRGDIAAKRKSFFNGIISRTPAASQETISTRATGLKANEARSVDNHLPRFSSRNRALSDLIRGL
jgi:hypothetical protein